MSLNVVFLLAHSVPCDAKLVVGIPVVVQHKPLMRPATLLFKPSRASRFYLSGFLAKSALGDLISRSLSEHARPASQQFPPEVGAALSSLALERENWERAHLDKEPFEQDRTLDEWAPPSVLVRRLYRMRRPFEHYKDFLQNQINVQSKDETN